MRMRSLTAGFAFASFLAGVALFHVTRTESSGCSQGIPCDPRMYLPFGTLAVILVLGSIAILPLLALVMVAPAVRKFALAVWRLDHPQRG
jgi:hypothetical protein